MKLGILVVYLVNDDNEKLLDIHLDHINKYTDATFVIYAGINMLLPRFVEKLKQFDFVKVYDLKPYNGEFDESRGSNEHSHYLEQLINKALKDGAEYFVIMHPDSFPVKKGWESELIKKTSETCPLISVFPQMSACTFFHRDFYMKYNPRLLPNNRERDSKDWLKFQKGNQPNYLIETGMGYAFRVFQEELEWKKLVLTNQQDSHHHFGGVYGNMIFHLGSAAMYDRRPMQGYVKNNSYNKFKQFVIGKIPVGIKSKLKTIIPDKVVHPEIEKNKREYLKIRDSLLNDTENFLKSIKPID